VGRIAAVLVVSLTTWGALAQIWPGAFQVGSNKTLKELIWGPKSIWLAGLALGCVVGLYIWNLEDRLSHLPGATSSITSEDETGIKIVSWGPLPNSSGCTAMIDASKLPVAFRDKYEIAMVCGFVDPSVDRQKDTRISVSALFTPQDALQISLPFSKTMADALAAEQRAAIEKLIPRPTSGTLVGVMNMVWFEVILLPKGSDRSNIQKLSDVLTAGGKIAEARASVGVGRNVPAP